MQISMSVSLVLVISMLTVTTLMVASSVVANQDSAEMDFNVQVKARITCMLII